MNYVPSHIKQQISDTSLMTAAGELYGYISSVSDVAIQFYRVSAKKRPDFIAFSGSTEYGYGLIIDKYRPHNTPSLI
jgi:hypothetical protein